MNDPIEKLIEEIRLSSEVQHARFANSFLNNVAEVFERDGFGATRAFLLEKRERYELRAQAEALLKVLDMMGKHPEIRQRRAIGRTIIKAIIALKSTGTRSPRGGKSQ
jgi:hypothetical protein